MEGRDGIRNADGSCDGCMHEGACDAMLERWCYNHEPGCEDMSLLVIAIKHLESMNDRIDVRPASRTREMSQAARWARDDAW